jgi:hypothetical protein
MQLAKTEAGKKAITDRSMALNAKQRSALIIFNGERKLEEVLKMVAGLGVTMGDVEHMMSQGLLVELGATDSAKVEAHVKIVEPLGSFVELNEAQSRYMRAYPLATKLTASMGLRGFRLNLAVEAAGSYSQLVELFPKIKEAAGAEKALDLELALRGNQ